MCWWLCVYDGYVCVCVLCEYGGDGVVCMEVLVVCV